MSTKNLTVDVLTVALQEVNKAIASYRATNPVDGGTCNFDSVIITPEGERVATLAKRLADAGFGDTTVTERYGRKCLFINVGESAYQGGPRTKIVQLACEVLKKHGVPASVYYQMD